MSQHAEELFSRGIALENSFDFEKARSSYDEILQHFSDEAILKDARRRMEDMDDLIAEKKIYQRIHENGIRVLTDIGINISETPELMDILMEADAIDFENESAIFIPLKRDYIDRCLAQVPRTMPGDPGPNTFGTGATPPFLKRAGDDELRPANRKEYEEIVQVVGEHQNAVGIFSLPVASDKSISLFEIAQLMEKGFPGLKMTTTKGMSDEETAFLKGKDHWVDGTSLITSFSISYSSRLMAGSRYWALRKLVISPSEM